MGLGRATYDSVRRRGLLVPVCIPPISDSVRGAFVGRGFGSDEASVTENDEVRLRGPKCGLEEEEEEEEEGIVG